MFRGDALVGVVGDFSLRLSAGGEFLGGVIEPDCWLFLRLSSASSRACRLLRKSIIKTKISNSIRTIPIEVRVLYFPFVQFHYLVHLLKYHNEF